MQAYNKKGITTWVNSRNAPRPGQYLCTMTDIGYSL
jgi:hypothetical protein